jgi:hydroxypyruvate reductase
LNDRRRDALRIFRAALKAADPYRAVLARFSCDGKSIKYGRARFRLSDFDRIQVIGAGKGGASMARAVEKVLGSRVAGGLVNVPDGPVPKLRWVELNPCGHPIPDARGAEGAQRILDIAHSAGARDLLICVISGGASAMLPAPAPPLTLADKQDITRRLLFAGATIHELNVVRKHLSVIKGGQLAAAAWPATVLTLALSDVVGDDPSVIGSGPTAPNESTREDAERILGKYRIPIPSALHDTPKPRDPVLARAHYEFVGSNRQAIAAAAAEARGLGYRTMVLSTTIEGEARETAGMHAAIAREVLMSGQPARPPLCLLSGGETTVTVRGDGMGGRNQEFVLAAALEMRAQGPVTILSAGTDGIDGPTDAAGAVADSTTLAKATLAGLNAREFLDNNDSYRFFEALKALIKTGPTGTNVMDVRIMLIG